MIWIKKFLKLITKEERLVDCFPRFFNDQLKFDDKEYSRSLSSKNFSSFWAIKNSTKIDVLNIQTTLQYKTDK